MNISFLYSVPFTVSDGGELMTKTSLDREGQGAYVFDMYVKDDGSPSKTSSAKVTVIVEDVNDFPPAFSSDVYYGNVVEDDWLPKPRQRVRMVRFVNDILTFNSGSVYLLQDRYGGLGR